jgi:hypothetical protein
LKTILDYAKPEIKDRIFLLCPEALMILCDFIVWCKQKQINPIISDAVSSLKEDETLSRVSSTHREGRAFDVSCRNFTKDQIDECVRVFSFKYRNIAAISAMGDAKLVYVHDAGTGSHMHFQVARKFKMPLNDF